MILRAFIFALILAAAIAVQGQSTAFTYQGVLNTSGTPATGNHDFEFRIYDAPAGGAQVGSTLTRTNVPVTAGAFAVELNFGGLFTGEGRFMEIAVKPEGGPTFTILAPRSPFTSAPYAIKSLASNVSNLATNANQLGGVAASQYVVTTDPRMTDARTPAAGSGNYIQNQSVGPQASSSFNISGNGFVGGSVAVGTTAAGTYRLNVQHGGSSGILNKSTAGSSTVDIDAASGEASLRFFRAGVPRWTFANRLDNNNLEIQGAGSTPRIAISGASGDVGIGETNPVYRLDVLNDNGAGIRSRSSGGWAGMDIDSANGDSALRFYELGQGRWVMRNRPSDDALEFFEPGTSGGSRMLIQDGTGNVGIDVSAPQFRLHVDGGSDAEPGGGGYIVAGATNAANVAIDNNEIMARNNGAAATLALNADGGNVNLIQAGTGNVGIGTSTPDDKLHVSGIIRVAALGSAGSTAVCRNASFQLSTCSSSLRYKTNFASFRPGLEIVNRLRPITFDWKDGGMHDLGLGAEDVAAIEPLLVNYNDKGEVEGVKYDRIGVVAVNAIKEQQAELESLRLQVAELKKLVCATNKSAAVCKEKK